MHRTLFALIALIAVALPASASAGHREQAQPRDSSSCDRPVRSGYVTVGNDNDVPLQITIDGEAMGSVGPGQTARYGPLPEGQHKVSARFVCNKRRLNRRVFSELVYVDARRPARVAIPAADLVIVELTNKWIEGMDIAIDGRVVDSVGARDTAAFIARSHTDLTLIAPNGASAMTVFLSEHGLSTQTMSLIPPRKASVTIYNPTRARLQLVDDRGNVLCDLAPWSTERVRLTSGWAGLTVRFRGRTVDSTKLIASPFASTRWDISPRIALYDTDDGRGHRGNTHTSTTISSRHRHHHSSSSQTRVSWRSRWGYVW